MKLRKATAIVLALVMLFALVLTGCGNAATGGSTSGGSTSGGSTAPAAPAKTYTLRVHHHEADGSLIDTWMDQWAAEVKEKSGGQLILEIYPGAILGSQKQVYEMVTNGTCDIAWTGATAVAGTFPMTECFQLPMLGIKSVEMGSNILMDMWEQTDYLDHDYRDFELLLLHSTAGTYIAIKEEKDLNSLADLKGMLLRTSGTWATKYCEALGASPVTLSAGDVYSAFEKGMIDGIIAGDTFLSNYQIYELCKLYYAVNSSVNPDILIMNKDTYASLPTELQDILRETTGRTGALQIAALYDAETAEFENQVTPHGGKIVTPSAQLMEEMTAVSGPIWDEWVAANSGNGDAQGCLDWLRNAVANY